MNFLALYLLAGIAMFLRIIYWAVIIDVLLSWLTLFGLHIIIGPLNSITRPLYDITRKYFPTRIGMMDIAPLLLILVIDLVVMFIPTIANSFR